MTYEKVDWIDARSEDGWTEQDDLDMRVAEITTLGHVVKETADVLCIASSMDNHGDLVAGIMFIPRRCIIHRYAIVDPEENP